MSASGLARHPTHSTRRHEKTMKGALVSTLDWGDAGSVTDWDDGAHQARILPDLETEESLTDWESESPQAEAHQPRIPGKHGATAAGETTPPQTAPRTTRIAKQDTGSPVEDVAGKRTMIYPSLGVVQKSTRSQNASATILTTRKDACLPMLRHMMEQVTLVITLKF